MSDPRIAQLRAKADSTTFPAEAAALRAKADELEAREPKRPNYVGQGTTARDVHAEYERSAAAYRERQRTRASGTRVTINFGGMADSGRLAAEMMAKMAAAMREQEARLEELRRAAEAYGGRTTRVTFDGVTYTKVTDVGGRSYWTRTE